MSKLKNTLPLEEVEHQDPLDLMSIKELCLKHSYDYSYLYQQALIKKEINVYFRGTWKLSESEVLEFSRKIKEMKFSKNKTSKGALAWQESQK